MTMFIALSKEGTPEIWKSGELAVAAAGYAEPTSHKILPLRPALRPLSVGDLSNYMDRFAAVEMRGRIADAPLGTYVHAG